MFNINQHKTGVLIAEGYSYGVTRSTDKFFTDSHSCGAVGAKVRVPNGKACIIECDTFYELLRVCKRATGSKNVEYIVNYINVQVKDNIIRNYEIDQEAATQEIVRLESSQAETVPLNQTSVMVPIVCAESNVEDEIEICDNGNEIRRKTKDNIIAAVEDGNVLLGGINLIVFGDLMQLPPIRGSQVFNQLQYMASAIHLWQLCTLVELRDNMRHQGENTFVEVLNALRVGEMKQRHMRVLLNKVCNNDDRNGEFSIEKALRMCPTYDHVTKYNDSVLQHFPRKEIGISRIKTQDQLVDATRTLNIETLDTSKIIPTDINKTVCLPAELEIFVGVQMMLRSNIDVKKGLVNGAIGFMTKIHWLNFRRSQMYEQVIPSITVNVGNNGVHRIEPISMQFPAKHSYGTAKRRML
ncbi:ATP-dependent DNA helicase PIF1 like protein [Argiope bruennichi]|uniref:ATP-dependent DNA helicase n=1 Tax=Argiope bruennichi TaxID=94029 RepID=A0A8T0EI43_ARGBR|nr:ATP-dependent DNA helicase PIF1 like protein [Argiope bruennichi]